MASKKNKLIGKRQERLSAIMTQALALNLRSIEEYRAWCGAEGFSAGLNKTRIQLMREQQHFKYEQATQKLKQQKREGNRRCVIQKLYTNELNGKDLGSEVMQEISAGFRKAGNRKLLRTVLLQLDENSKLLTHVDYVKGIIKLVAHFHLWLRPVSEWEPNTRNADRQFASFARHLFARYEVPAFMDSVWLRGSVKAQGWFIHLGKGENIRTASSLPITMTSKMAHHFSRTPANYDVKAAFRWAQVHALGGNKRIADAVAETRMARSFKDDEFWLSVLLFFIANPLLDTQHYGPIVDYIWHKKYENRMVFIEPGVAREEGPEQPNFSMHGRTPGTLLRQVEDWHRRLGRESRCGNLNWEKSSFSDFRYREGQANSRNMKVWTIRELLNSNELVTEGRAQSHCVATYARSWFTGSTSIWTMDLQETQARRKMVTIELQNRSKIICQVRGLRNRKATDREMDVIRRWADMEGLTVAAYL